MAKKKVADKNGPNKSQAIREQLTKMPEASVTEIAEAASKKVGEDVSAGLVYQVKAKSGAPKKKGSKKRAAKKTVKRAASRGAASKGASKAASKGAGAVNTNLIMEAATLLGHAGNAKTAQEALELATSISKALKK
jgi:hypothetical protein